MCVCVCVCVCCLLCVPACLRSCVPACVPACLRACVPACMRACLRACVPACLRACLRACVRAYVCVCVCVCVLYVLVSPHNGDLQRHRILLAHTKSIYVESGAVVVFRIFSAMTLLFATNPPSLARIFPKWTFGCSTNLNCPFTTLDCMRGMCRLLRATSMKARYF